MVDTGDHVSCSKIEYWRGKGRTVTFEYREGCKAFKGINAEVRKGWSRKRKRKRI